MVNKLMVSIFIITFWVMYPLTVMFMGGTDYIQIESDTGEDVNIGNALTKPISIYFTIMFLYIPNAPFWINSIVMIFRLVSALVIYLLLRGN